MLRAHCHARAPCASAFAFSVLVAACTLILPTTGLSFVKRNGHQLQVDGSPFYYLGADAYWLADYAKDSPGIADQFFSDAMGMGLRVFRVWAFNTRMPYAAGQYDAYQVAGLDYVVDSAARHGARLILSCGNVWDAYRSAEDFMLMAGVSPDGQDILSGFYGNGPTMAVYKQHIQDTVTRVNKITGLAYNNDPTIMGWDVINEPRCPGCMDSASQATHLSWLATMSDALAAAAPQQLVTLATEGYFMYSNANWNPGAGAECQGENWEAATQLSGVSLGTVHVYMAQMEELPPDYHTCSFECFANFFQQYVQKHVQLASGYGKPLIVEEFNVLLGSLANSAQQVQLFRLAYDMLAASQSTGDALAGVMFWSGVVGGSVPDDGYNIYLDVGAAVSPSPPPPPYVVGAAQAPPYPDIVSSGAPGRAPIIANPETLSAFQRGPQAAACANTSAYTWWPGWTESGAIDLYSLQSRTSGQSVQSVIQAAANLANGRRR